MDGKGNAGHQMAMQRKCKDEKGEALERLGEDLRGGAEQRKGEEKDRYAQMSAATERRGIGPSRQGGAEHREEP